MASQAITTPILVSSTVPKPPRVTVLFIAPDADRPVPPIKQRPARWGGPNNSASLTKTA